ncbi:hypothetical protein, partial [Rhizobium sp. Leaf306]|uniref:hypothetical protein n=1 Tax=Rhizobium sp. Leaf306 TaxID=1736330 RepID=UPI001AEC1350
RTLSINSRITAKTNLVFSYQNVTVICLLTDEPKSILRDRRPRFSFFSYSIVKEPTLPPQKAKTSKTQEPNRNPAPISIRQSF